MKGIVFVLHGRKGPLSTANLAVVKETAARLTIPYEIGLLEGAQQTLEEAVESLLAKQVEEIIFLPVLLFPGTHVKEDLPQRATALLKEKVPYQLLEPLGTTQAVSEYLIQQIQQTKLPDRNVLLIAHGTPHHKEPFLQLEQLAEKLSQVIDQRVYAAGYYGEHPYRDVLAEHPEAMIIQPLFLTENYLAKKIKEEIFQQRGPRDQLLPTLQDQPVLVAAMLERLEVVVCIQS